VTGLLAGCGGGGSPSTTQQTNSVGGGVGQPVAVYAPPVGGKPPRALLMLIHGGGWSGLNPNALKVTEATAAIFRAFGFETVTVDYRRGAQGVADVEQMYRQARQRVGSLPICALGASAGGHIALLLAEKFPDLRCAVDMAGPTELAALKSQGSLAGYQIAVHAFGAKALDAYSPALHAASIKARLLLVYADDDPLVPVAQGQAMKRAFPAAQLITLPPGPAPFVHTGVGAPAARTGVSQTAKHASSVAELRFLIAST
jgi:acetyl esterase/lipase